MSVAHYDAIIACWDAKYTYWFFRPVQMDPTLTTVFPTPNYPSYPSGHACASGAISEVLADQFPAYAELIRGRATEALESRMWAGIHFPFEMVVGRRMGKAVAEKVIAHAQQDGAIASQCLPLKVTGSFNVPVTFYEQKEQPMREQMQTGLKSFPRFFPHQFQQVSLMSAPPFSMMG
jgi:hypothetical protein